MWPPGEWDSEAVPFYRKAVAKGMIKVSYRREAFNAISKTINQQFKLRDQQGRSNINFVVMKFLDDRQTEATYL